MYYNEIMEKNSYTTIRVDLKNVAVEILLNLETFGRNFYLIDSISDKQIHFHTYTELFFVGENELTLITEKGKHSYKNAVIAIPPYFRHYSAPNKDTYDFLIRVIPQNETGMPLFKQFNDFIKNGIRSASINERFLFYLREINAEEDNSNLKIKSLLTLIVLEFFKTFHIRFEEKSKTPSDRSKYLYLISQIINSDFNEKVDLAYAAERLHLSKKQTSSIIRKEYSMSLSELRTDKKLTAAAMLLKNTDKSVAEIISELDFGTDSYFFVLFKNKYGITPLAYRKHSGF